jgi:hypothetical protein
MYFRSAACTNTGAFPRIGTAYNEIISELKRESLGALYISEGKLDEGIYAETA